MCPSASPRAWPPRPSCPHPSSPQQEPPHQPPRPGLRPSLLKQPPPRASPRQPRPSSLGTLLSRLLAVVGLLVKERHEGILGIVSSEEEDESSSSSSSVGSGLAFSFLDFDLSVSVMWTWNGAPPSVMSSPFAFFALIVNVCGTSTSPVLRPGRTSCTSWDPACGASPPSAGAPPHRAPSASPSRSGGRTRCTP